MGGSSKKQTVGYRYLWGQHAILTSGPIDKITRLFWDNKQGWAGENTGGQIQVNARNLFGGDKREGGVSGTIDFENGEPDQGQNSYLVSKVSSMVSGFRGVAALVFRQFYHGLNPYAKPFAVRAQRIHRRTMLGVEQWYDAKAEIFGEPDLAPLDTEDFSDPSIFERDDGDDEFPAFEVINGTLRPSAVKVPDGETRFFRRDIQSATLLSRLEFDVSVVDASDKDPLRLQIMGVDGTPWFRFISRREVAFDPLQRPSLTAAGGVGAFEPIGSEALAEGVDYRVSIDFALDTRIATVEVRVKSTGVLFATSHHEINAFELAQKIQFLRDDDTPPRSVDAYSNLAFFGYVNAGDMNPAHMIREVNHDPDQGMAYPESDCDDDAFEAAADTLWDEAFGLSVHWDRQSTLGEFCDEIKRHIDAAHYIDRRTGKFTLKLIRADYDPDELLVLDESSVIRIEGFSRPTIDELINTVQVKYRDRDRRAEGMVVAQDTALVQVQGRVTVQTISYPFVRNRGLAARLAERDLRALSRPLATCTVYATRVASGLQQGDVFRLQWPDIDSGTPIVMRVTDIAFGDGRSTKVRIRCAEDVFALPEQAIIVSPPSEWINPSQTPDPAENRIVTEAPYYELVQRLGQANADNQLELNEFAGWLVASAANPGNAISATLAVDDGSGYEDVAAIDFCPFAILDTDIAPLTTVIPIRDGVDLDNVEVGTHAQIGHELVRVDAVSDTEITVGRGVLDTVPRQHDNGTKIFFWDAYAEGDETEYAASTALDVKILPVSGAGAVELENATADQIEFDQRALRPYPPGNFKVGGAAYPSIVELTDSMPITWAHRDRTQQTSGVLEDTTDGDIGPEDGTTYTVQARNAIADTVIDEQTGVAGTSTTLDITGAVDPAIRFVLKSVRDGLDSWHQHDWAADVAGAPTVVAFTVTGEDEWVPPAGVTNLTDVLVVAGGAGGGTGMGGDGGAGAGGVRHVKNYPVTPGVPVPVLVGAGGIGRDTASSGVGTAGGASKFGTIEAVGGGSTRSNGGSGGGGSSANVGSSAIDPGLGIAGQGHDGGVGFETNTASIRGGGGGGGAGEPGYDGASSAGGAGGDGVDMSSVFGDTYGDDGWFGGGGGGATSAPSGTAGTGGKGGGGAGGRRSSTLSIARGGDALPNTGGGGGTGQRSDSEARGGNGGSGIILIRYFGPPE